MKGRGLGLGLRLGLVALLCAGQAMSTPPTGPDDPDDGSACDAPRPGSLTLNTVPWTMVYLDGVLVGSTPLFQLAMAAGDHQLTLVNEARGVDVAEDITIDEGRAHKLKLLLAAEQAPATLLDNANNTAEVECVDDEDAGFVSVQTTPWSKVWLNGKLVGVTPLFQQRVRAGEHVLRFKGRDGQVLATRVMVTPGEVVKVSLALPAADGLGLR
jgi:hypothetical protein